jgi:hypothetical protein
MTLEYSCFAKSIYPHKQKKIQDFFTLKIFRKVLVGWYKEKWGKEF